MKKRLISKLISLLTNNWGMKLLALIIAILAWFSILVVQDPEMTKTISGIKVTAINAETLENAGKTYEFDTSSSVSIEVTGISSVISALSADDFSAVADLKKLDSITGAVPVDVTLANNLYRQSDIRIDSIGTGSIANVTIEDKASTVFPVRVSAEGKPYSGYVAGAGTAIPNQVRLEGPKSVIARIASVVVNVSVEGRTSEVTEKATLEYYDANGELVQSENIKGIGLEDTINVTVPIYPTRSIQIRLTTTGEPEDGYALADFSYQPETISIAGPQESLRQLPSAFELESFDISGANGVLQETLTIDEETLGDLLPANTFIVDNTLDVAVEADIRPLETKTLEVPVSRVVLVNQDSRYTYSLSSTDPIEVTLEGLEDEVNITTITDITLTVDVSNVKEIGTVQIPSEVQYGTSVSTVGSVNVGIVVRNSDTTVE